MDQLIKQKFDHFEAQPPENLWAGIQAGITPPSFWVVYGKKLAVAAIFLLTITTGLWMILRSGGENVKQSTRLLSPKDSRESSTTINGGSSEEAAKIENTTSRNSDDPIGSETDIKTDAQKANQNEKKEEIAAGKEKIHGNKGSTVDPSTHAESKVNGQTKTEVLDYDKAVGTNKLSENNTNNGQTGSGKTGVKSSKNTMPVNLLNDSDFGYTSINSAFVIAPLNISLTPLSKPQFIAPKPTFETISIAQDVKPKPKPGFWEVGFYFSPEVILNDFDSVTIEPTYSFGIEPTYYINKHLFVRSGLGISIARDRGFATIDYLSNDLVGIYEDVYDISFDSIGGVVVPTFYTKTTEIWDTIRHYNIRELTNKYLYLQIPVLVGYYKETPKFKWYFYGGPAFNIMVSEQIDEPVNDLNYLEIIKYRNTLPERSPYFMQLWIGAGIEYKLGNKLGIAFEPNYRYYFKQVFEEPKYQTPLSGFTLRIGLVYTIQ